ncbi:hypothetical protein, partial [Aquisphaera insulae]|uniref:hypothetical protein n=1 Tax=Aquisphaera insulae TaxID=2712864 RepID=UPI0013ECF066
NGQVLAIEFVDENPDPLLCRKVLSCAREWEKYINLRILTVPLGEHAEKFGLQDSCIRISFRNKGHYSSVGTDSRLEKDHSMNLEVSRDSNDMEVKRSALHEIGHALGFQHEHQSPAGGIQWKQPEAMQYYLKYTGWSEDKVQSNIFGRLERAHVVATSFDAKSIMLYPIPPGLTTNGFSVGWNNDLSAIDKQAAAAIYPPYVDKAHGVVVKIAPGFVKPGVILGSISDDSVFRRLSRFGASNDPVALEPGDEITAIDGREIKDIQDYKDMARFLDQKILVRVCDVRNGQDFDLVTRGAE